MNQPIFTSISKRQTRKYSMGVPLLLHDLQNFASKGNVISLLTILNDSISSNLQELEFLYKSNGVFVIMSFLENDRKLANICLKILANASKRNEKIRSVLLENNIFSLLALKLKSETDFSKENLILYSALMVVLVQGDCEAQNRLRTSGCLSSLVYILRCILSEAENKPVPSKNTELFIYTIIASQKSPRHFQNQIEIGQMIPEVLKYLEKQTIFSNSKHPQLLKCFWFFLKNALNKNEINQQKFLKFSGFSILFRSIQEAEEGNSEEREDLLINMTGVLLRFKSQKDFLFEASNYCPVMILCSLLNTCNIRVIQQTLIFLDSLTRQCPHSMKILKSKEILEEMKKARAIILQNPFAAELCKDLWNRINMFEKATLNSNQNFSNTFAIGDTEFQDFMSEINFFENYLCVVHDADILKSFRARSESSLNFFSNIKAIDGTDRNQKLRKIKLSGANLNIHKSKLREKEKKLKKIIMQSFFHSSEKTKIPFNIATLFWKKVFLIFQNLVSFFTGVQTNDFLPTH